MIKDGRNPGDEAGRRSQDEGDTNEEKEGKGGYSYCLGDCQLDGLTRGEMSQTDPSLFSKCSNDDSPLILESFIETKDRIMARIRN